MAYNKINILKRIIDMQQLFKSEYKPGMSIEWVYNNVIYHRFKISRRTFYKWITYPAENELKELIHAKTELKTKYKQIAMDFSQHCNEGSMRTGSD